MYCHPARATRVAGPDPATRKRVRDDSMSKSHDQTHGFHFN